MELITAVNTILPALGEHPVTSVTVKHPTLAVIIPQIEAQRDLFLLRGWWFNEHTTTLYPSSEGEIALPDDTLSFVPTYVNAAVRGTKLYNTDTLNYIWEDPVEGTLTSSLAFNLLPESAAQYVLYSALITAYASDIGLEQTLQLWSTLATTAHAAVLSEHLRNRKYSTTRSSRFQRLQRALRS